MMRRSSEARQLRAPLRLPTPYPDELLYSVIARAAYRNALWSPKGLMEAVFGDRTVLSCPDLPCRLRFLADTAGVQWQMQPSDIALRYTLVGYYTHYLGAAGRDRILGLMGGKAAHIHLRLGICAGSVRAPTRFRLCPVCTSLDVRRTGETYWRRAHHLPGVLVCQVHAVPLSEVDVPFRSLGRHEHVHASLQFLDSGRPLLTSGVDPKGEVLALAKAASRLLDGSTSDSGPMHDYRQALSDRGFRGSAGADRLWDSLVGIWGVEVLQNLLRGGKENGPQAWLQEVFRLPRRPLHPLKHLLLERVLASHEALRPAIEAPSSRKTWGIFKNSDLRQKAQQLSDEGLTVNAVARKLGVDWKTANRLLEPLPVALNSSSDSQVHSDRAAWRDHVKRHPNEGRAFLKRMEPALYARLYRKDRDWLMQHGERLPRSSGKARVAWESRDERLAQSVQVHALALKQQKPLQRASVNRVLGVLGARAVVSRYGIKLPLTRENLRKHCEPVEEFQLRRILSTGLMDEPKLNPVWKVMRAASLNPNRYADKGLGLVSGARLQHEKTARRPSRNG